jgi:hypothetical protein
MQTLLAIQADILLGIAVVFFKAVLTDDDQYATHHHPDRCA